MEMVLYSRVVRVQPYVVFNAGVSIDSMTWWFWIKAGMGLTVGAAIVAAAWGIIFWGAILTFGALSVLGRR